jgi:hypothetical protein
LFRAGQNQVSSAQLAVEKSLAQKGASVALETPIVAEMLAYQNFMEIREIGSTGFLPSYQILPAFHRTPIGPCILQSSS